METPGLMLKREREARGLTLLEVSKVTRIPVPTLEAIENNAFEELPAEVFVRGFLRNYARQLSIPVDEIIEAYEVWQRQHKTADSRSAIIPVDIAPANTYNEMPEAENNDEELRQPPFRFAYLAIVFIAIASIGLSMLFMGTGEAEESDADFNVQSGENVESPFVISNTSAGWPAE
jgi:cytoskeletal protein RodZ